MRRGRLVAGVLSAACLAGCESLAGIDDLRLAADVDAAVAGHDSGHDDTGASASPDAGDEGGECSPSDSGDPAEASAIDALDMVPVDAGSVAADVVTVEAGFVDAGGIPDSAGPQDSAAEASAQPVEAGQDAAVDARADSGSCACGALAVCVSGKCTPGLRVFVTNQTYNGALGGHAGADTTCQTLATGAGLGGTWMAWISDSTSSPSQRFSMPTLGYYLLDGTLVAASWTALTKSGPAHPIDVTETGASLLGASTDASKTWTATLTTGVLGTASCNDFGSYAVAHTGQVGHCTGTGTINWTSGYTSETCDVPNHLYCFEQEFER
jgi:hypothetical protein